MTEATAEDPWAGFTGQSAADAEDAELIDPILKALGESRARFGDLEQRIREKQAEALEQTAGRPWVEDLEPFYVKGEGRVSLYYMLTEIAAEYRNGGSDG